MAVDDLADKGWLDGAFMYVDIDFKVFISWISWLVS